MIDPFNPPPGVSGLTALTSWFASLSASVVARVRGNPGSPVAYVSGQYYYCNSASNSAGINTLGNNTCRVSRWDVTADLPVAALFTDALVVGEAGSKFRIGVWNDDGTGKPGSLRLDAGQMNGDSATQQELAVSMTLAPGTYWVGGAVQNAPTTQPTMRCVLTTNMQNHFALGATLPPAATAAVGWAQTGQSGAFGAFTPSVSGSAPRIGFKVA